MQNTQRTGNVEGGTVLENIAGIKNINKMFND